MLCVQFQNFDTINAYDQALKFCTLELKFNLTQSLDRSYQSFNNEPLNLGRNFAVECIRYVYNNNNNTLTFRYIFTH